MEDRESFVIKSEEPQENDYDIKIELTEKDALEDEELDEIAGGFLGADMYTEDEYKAAGIRRVPFYADSDKYFVVCGNSPEVELTQRQAEKLTAIAIETGKAPTEADIARVKAKNLQ
ncbi:MAG: hypothetical protein K6B75_06330 [Lachnospiraceae bacterium]|nr:hypothetical protein [Lachnospiraceae bacterium]